MLGECKPNDSITADDCNRFKADKFKVSFNLMNGMEVELSFEEYIFYVLMYQRLPSECNIDEFKEYKLMCEI